MEKHGVIGPGCGVILANKILSVCNYVPEQAYGDIKLPRLLGIHQHKLQFEYLYVWGQPINFFRCS